MTHFNLKLVSVLSKTCKIVLEHTLKCSQLISSSDNKKILLTTKNVRLDSGHYATKYYYRVIACVVSVLGSRFLYGASEPPPTRINTRDW